MKTYWDYSEKERSEMTEDAVRGMLDMELMDRGVLKVVAPVLREIKPVNLPKRVFFEVGPVIFSTMEQAAAFIALEPMTESYKYEAGWENKFPKKMDDAPKQVSLTDEQSILNAITVLASNKSAKEENEKATKIYEEAAKKMEKTIGGVWDDWFRCRQVASDHKKVIDTLETYKAMTNGDAALAEKFLEKVFDAGQIHDALVWFGLKDQTSAATQDQTAAAS